MRRNIKISLCFALFSACAIHYAFFSFADAVYTKEGKEIKGVVVEDYKDRIVLSTPNGEVEFKKSDIKELYYDNEEESLVSLAEQARERHDYARAFTYYNMALKANPSSKAANDGLVFLQGYLFRKEEAEKLDDIKRRENIERYGTVVQLEEVKTEEEKLKDLTARLRGIIGLTMEMDGSFPRVVDVRSKSPAYAAGIRKDDVIVSLWTKLIGHMSLAEIMEEMLDKPSLEIKCTVERYVDVDPRELSFSMELKGLTVSGVKGGEGKPNDAGIKKDDLVVSIDGKLTRYMPMKKAVKLMKKAGDTVKLTIRREVLIWRGE